MKLLSYTKKFAFGLFLLAVQGCSIGDEQKDVVIQVAEEFSINLIESLGENRQLKLELKSIELEPCLNSTIDRAVISESNKVTLILNGIIPASDCIPGLAPAYSSGNAGSLAENTYDFLINIRNTVENYGKLIVKSDQYEINMLSTDGIVLENTIMYRIPENTIWGYYAYDDASLVGNTPTNFINEIKNISSPINLNEGYYGYFTAKSNNEIEFIDPPQKNHVGYFFYRFNGNENSLKDVLDNHRNGPSAGNIELAIFNSEGKTF